MRSIGGDCLLCNDFALQTFFVENALMILESIQEELIFSVAKSWFRFLSFSSSLSVGKTSSSELLCSSSDESSSQSVAESEEEKIRGERKKL